MVDSDGVKFFSKIPNKKLDKISNFQKSDLIVNYNKSISSLVEIPACL